MPGAALGNGMERDKIALRKWDKELCEINFRIQPSFCAITRQKWYQMARGM